MFLLNAPSFLIVYLRKLWIFSFCKNYHSFYLEEIIKKVTACFVLCLCVLWLLWGFCNNEMNFGTYVEALSCNYVDCIKDIWVLYNTPCRIPHLMGWKNTYISVWIHEYLARILNTKVTIFCSHSLIIVMLYSIFI